MPLTIVTGKTFANGEKVTPTKLNQAVNSATYTGELEIAKGGTGASTVAGARTAFGLDSTATITYAATTDLDLSATADLKTLALTGNVTFTTSNRASGRSLVLRIVADGSTRTLAFPAGWVFVTDKPTQIAANKTALLVLQCYGSNDSDIVASYAVQA